jgi:hypothetical protein
MATGVVNPSRDTLRPMVVGVDLIDVIVHMLGVDIISGDTGSVLLLEQQTSPSKSGVVVDLVLELAVASMVTLVVLVLMLSRLFVLV